MKQLVFFIGMLFLYSSCEDIITVPDISQETVHILAPVDGTVLSNTDTTFSWETVDDAEKYTIQIARPNFVSANQILIDSTLANTTFTTTLEANEYEWRVKAQNTAYETAYTTQSFSVE